MILATKTSLWHFLNWYLWKYVYKMQCR